MIEELASALQFGRYGYERTGGFLIGCAEFGQQDRHEVNHTVLGLDSTFHSTSSQARLD